MALQSLWIETNLPKNLTDMIEDSLSKDYDKVQKDSLVSSGSYSQIRDSSNAWVPTSNWISTFVWERIERANRENFMYDIRNIDHETMQYTKYGPGQHYNWHTDTSLSSVTGYSGKSAGSGSKEQTTSEYIIPKVEFIRKLSFTLILSDHDEYEGGNLEFLDEGFNRYIAPRQRGTCIIFDSRTYHRVNKVKSGLRKTLVGWAVGPRWV